jgi:hypothetical protein
MQLKIKKITPVLFLIDSILLIINIKYKDQVASVIPDLDSAKFFFYLGTLFFIIYLITIKLKNDLTFAVILAIIFFAISMFFNFRLAKENYDRNQCEKGISEYFKYFEYESCEKIEKRFDEDLIKGELKYFQEEYDYDLEFLEKLKLKYGIEVIGNSCTQCTSMECYNELVKDYINNR